MRKGYDKVAKKQLRIQLGPLSLPNGNLREEFVLKFWEHLSQWSQIFRILARITTVRQKVALGLVGEQNSVCLL